MLRKILIILITINFLIISHIIISNEKDLDSTNIQYESNEKSVRAMGVENLRFVAPDARIYVECANKGTESLN